MELAIPTRDSAASTGEILEGVIRDGRDLLKVEVELAKDEMRREVRSAARSLLAFTLVLVLTASGLALLFAALAMSIADGPMPIAITGAALLGVAGVTLWAGLRWFPRRVLPETGKRLESDVVSLKEHLT